MITATFPTRRFCHSTLRCRALACRRARGWFVLGLTKRQFLFKQLIFNSLTNCLGPRKLLHSGKLYKTKSNKELHGFLFNDFLLLTYMVKQFAVSSGSEKLFSSKSNAQFKMYKTVSVTFLAVASGV